MTSPQDFSGLARLERNEGVATLTLTRPEMQNALNPELLEAVRQALATLRTDAGVRALILAAEGAAFSIGGDMRRFSAEGKIGKENLRQYSSRLVGLLNEMVLDLVNLPQPVIGALHGTVTGGSIGFLAGCDLAVMADTAVLKAHYTSAGYCPDGGWTAAIADVIGSRRAAAALLLNRSITAADALDWGLVNDVVPLPQVASTAQTIARRIAGYPAGTQRHAKRLLRHAADLGGRLEAERRGFLELVASDEAMAGVERFLQTFTAYPGAE